MREEPQRTCVGCRVKRPKQELLRLTRAQIAPVALDVGERGSGRGAYVCPDPACVAKATRRGALGRALRVALAEEDLARLRTEMEREIEA